MKIEIRRDSNPSIGRVIVVDIENEWEGNVSVAKGILEEVCENWPIGTGTKFLITCGGFLEFSWLDKLPEIRDNKNPNPEAANTLVEEGKKCCERLLSGGLYEKLRKRTRYLTLGVDSFKPVVSTTQNYISYPHIELVLLVDLGERTYHWTGKSYPTPAQEKGLVRISDLSTHFFVSEFGKVMILGCHDLNIFNNRNWKRTSEWRRGIKISFRELAGKEEPVYVLHHPHTTDSTRIWANGWKGVREISTVKEYAGAGRYAGSEGKVRSELNQVLFKTKESSTIDFIISELK